jgi:hypothetical protein
MKGEHLEFDFDANDGCEVVGEAVEGVEVAMLEEVAIAAGEEVEFEIVVRKIDFGAENAAFATAVAAAEEQPFEAVWREIGEQGLFYEFAGMLEVIFESIASIDRVAGRGARARGPPFT